MAVNEFMAEGNRDTVTPYCLQKILGKCSAGPYHILSRNLYFAME